MANYQYDPLIPAVLDGLISETVHSWAEKRSLDYEPWYHGLPVWIVRRREGLRTTTVQVEVINSESITRLSFTPDASEDEITDQGDVRTIERKVAEAGSLAKARVQIALDRLVTRDGPDGLGFKLAVKAPHEITAALDAVWDKAESLQLTSEPIRIQYVTSS